MNKRLLLFSLVCTFFLATLPLPWLMAVPAVRSPVFSWMGGQLAGSIAADSCSFGWFSGLRCKGFRYRSAHQPFQLRAEELRSTKGLALLLLAPGYLGTINLKEPVLSLNRAPAASETAKQQKATAPLPFWWNRASFQLQTQRAQIYLQDGAIASPLLADATLSAALADGSLHYTLQGHAGSSEEANLRAEGFINAPPESSNSANLLSTSTIVLNSCPIAELPPLPWAPRLLASMGGKATGSCRLQCNTEGLVQAQGALSLHEPLLPPLTATDTGIRLDKASLLFDVSREGVEHWQVRQVLLDSGLARLDLRAIRLAEKTDLHASASFSLPLLSEGLRKKLALRPDAMLQSGTLSCSMQAAGPSSRLPLQLHCGISDIAAYQANTPVSWHKPLALSAQGIWQNEHLSVQAVRAQGAHFSLKADQPDAGGDTFSLSAAADIGALSQKLAQITLLPFQAQGRLSLTALRKYTGPVSRDDQLDCTITDFTLRRGAAQLLPAHQFSLEAKSSKADNGLISGTAQVAWWPGSFDVALHDLGGRGEARSGSYHVTGSMLLARLQPLIHSFYPSLNSLKLAGSMQFDMAARLQGSRHQLSTVQAVFNRPVLTAAATKAVYSFQSSRSVLAAGEAAQNLPAPRLHGFTPLQVASNADTWADRQTPRSFVDLDRQSLSLQPLVLLSDELQLQGGIALNQWQGHLPQYSLHAHGALDGVILDTLLRATNRMPAGLRLQGPVQLAFSTAYPGKPLPEVEIATHLDWAGFERDGRLLFHKRALNLYARLEAAASDRLSSWDIPEFSLHSPDLWAQGKGFLWDEKRSAGMLALQGQYRNGVPAQAAEAAGSASSPFQLSVPFR